MNEHMGGRPRGPVGAGCATTGGGTAGRGMRGAVPGRGEPPAASGTVTVMPVPPRTGLRRAPLSRTLCLEPALSSVALAREAVAAAVAEWGMAVDVDTAVLLTSELVANAVIHGGTPGKPVLLVLVDLGAQLRVEVHDPGGRGVGRARSVADGESGRGLAIVSALADYWDWEPTVWGKVVYFGLLAAREARAA